MAEVSGLLGSVQFKNANQIVMTISYIYYNTKYNDAGKNFERMPSLYINKSEGS